MPYLQLLKDSENFTIGCQQIKFAHGFWREDWFYAEGAFSHLRSHDWNACQFDVFLCGFTQDCNYYLTLSLIEQLGCAFMWHWKGILKWSLLVEDMDHIWTILWWPRRLEILVVRAIYVLKSSGIAWCENLAHIIYDPCYNPCESGPDVWMKSNSRNGGF